MTQRGKHKEEELADRLATGDSDAFKKFFHRHARALVIFAEELCNNKSEAEDIAAFAFQQYWLRRQAFPDLKSARSFLYTTVSNKCLDWLRHQKVVAGSRHELLHLLQHEPAWLESRKMQAELLPFIYEAIDDLPPAYKEVLTLTYLDGLSTAAIASQLGVSTGNIRMQRSRGIALARQALLRKGLLPSILWIGYGTGILP